MTYSIETAVSGGGLERNALAEHALDRALRRKRRNVARDKAHTRGADRIELTSNDADIGLSQTGEEQARVLGAWFARIDFDQRPDVLLASP
ncbi:hypothetical protein [Sphingomonas faeni]|uniref:hypothetical protein n=1 Tax=Sphingomonas faeni TaxID=185950 RepID=UPI0027D904BD|nr:hypothetical protein [Sphingomonas faeni]